MHVLALVGPTAVGKSGTALALANLLAPAAVEIINADAMQMYRGMDVGTAKAPEEIRSLIPHHMLDVWPITHRASVVDFRDAARAVINGMPAGSLPIAVGGSGLYLQALLDDLQVPATDPAVRARYEALLQQEGAAGLHARLRQADPAAAERIDAANGRRLVRALEVVALTGSFTASLPRDPVPWAPTTWVGLRAPLSELDEAIGERVEEMWRTGLVEEVAVLERSGLREGPTASKAIGYAECLAYLEGSLSRDEAIESTARRTRQLARRQLKWFRRDSRTTWIDVELRLGTGRAVEAAAQQVAALLSQERR